MRRGSTASSERAGSSLIFAPDPLTNGSTESTHRTASLETTLRMPYASSNAVEVRSLTCSPSALSVRSESSPFHALRLFACACRTINSGLLAYAALANFFTSCTSWG